MIPVSRRGFLKITGTGAAASVLTCSCALRPATVPSSAGIRSGSKVQTKADVAAPIVLWPDKVAYVCGCKPDVHNPGGGGDSSLFVGNYCRNSERFLLHWNLSSLASKPGINKAVVGLYCVAIYGTPSGRLIYAPLNSDWGETVTYNTQPEADADKRVSMAWPAKGNWQEVDVTGLVIQWLAAPNQNHGLIGYAVDVREETCSAVFASIQTPERMRPKLNIT